MFVIVMSNLVELFGCVRFAFLEEKKKKWLFRPPSRCLLFRRLWFWCCLLLLLKQNDRSCNCDFCWRRSVRSLTKWSSSDSELLCVCQHLECSMFDGGWTLLLNCCSQHSLFIVEILIILRLVFLCVTLPIFIFVVLGVGKRRVKIPWDVFSGISTVSTRLSFLVWKRIKKKVYEFVLRNGYWLSTTGSLL